MGSSVLAGDAYWSLLPFIFEFLSSVQSKKTVYHTYCFGAATSPFIHPLRTSKFLYNVIIGEFVCGHLTFGGLLVLHKAT